MTAKRLSDMQSFLDSPNSCRNSANNRHLQVLLQQRHHIKNTPARANHTNSAAIRVLQVEIACESVGLVRRYAADFRKRHRESFDGRHLKAGIGEIAPVFFQSIRAPAIIE